VRNVTRSELREESSRRHDLIGAAPVAYDWKTELLGVFSRHADSCPVRDGGECTCGPLGYRASVREWDSNRRTVSPTFETVHEALAWQRDQMAHQDASRGLAVERGELGALIDEFLQAAEDGMVRNGDGGPYSRDGVRALRGALSYVDSELGTMDVQDVRRRHVQALLDQLRGAGLAAARIRAVAHALDSVYGYAIQRELVGFSPVVALQLPESENGVAYAVPPPAATSSVPASEGAAVDAAGPDPAEQADDVQAAEYPAPPAYPTPPPGPYATPPGSWPWPTPPGAYPPPPGPYATPPGPYAAPPGAYPPPGPYATPPGAYPTPPGAYPTPPPYPPPYTGYATPYPAPATPPAGQSGIASAIFGAPAASPDADYDSTMQERWLWWTVRIVVIVFVLIALVLVAESV
jgi:hypothetical protein